MIRKAKLGAWLLSAIAAIGSTSCLRDVTGPGSGSPYALIALEPKFPAILSSVEGASDVAAFNRVRVTLRREDGTIQFDTTIAFPADAEEVPLSVNLLLPQNTPDDGVPLSLTMAYVNAQGDTVFRGGPVTVHVRPNDSSLPAQSVEIEVEYSGVGAEAVAVRIEPHSGNALAGTATTFTAVATDVNGATLPGTPVVFSTPDPDAAGLTSFTSGAVTWKSKRGPARVVASLLTDHADTATFQITLPASRLALASGGAQTQTISRQLAAPVVLRVEASDGVGVPGVSVTFAVTTGAGTLTKLTDVSDANGLVNTQWTLGSLVGAQTITATSAGLTGSPLTITATGLVPVPTQLAIAGTPTSVVAGVNFPPITVQVRDAGGIVVTQFNGPVTIALGTGSPNATLTGTTTVNAVNGVATFADLQLTQAATGFTLIATSGTLTAATTPTPITVTPAPPSQLLIVSGDHQFGYVNSPLPLPFRVRLRDAFNNSVPNAAIAFSLAQGAGTLAPVIPPTDAGGFATSQYTVGNVPGVQQIHATVVGSPALFVDFGAVAVTTAPTQINSVSAISQSVLAGTPQAAPFRVIVTDALDRPVAGVTVSWNITCDCSGSMTAVTSVTDASGIATSTLNIFGSQSTTTVDASVIGLAGSPRTFTVNILPQPIVFIADASTDPVIVNLGTDSARTVRSCVSMLDVLCNEPANLSMNASRSRVAIPVRFNNTILYMETFGGFFVTSHFDGSMDQPFGTAFSPNGAELWVANRGADTAVSGSVTVLDVVADTVITVIHDQSFHLPESIAIANGRAFVPNRWRGSITVINTTTYAVTDSLFPPGGGGSAPQHVVATPDGLWVYVSSNLGTVWKINTSTLAVTNITVPGSSRNMGVSPDGSKIYVGLQNSSIAVINVASNAVSTITFSGASSTWGVAISADGRLGFVTDATLGRVIVFDPATGTEIVNGRFPVTGFTAPRAIIAK